MKIKVTSTSPEGISVENGSMNQLNFLEVIETERINIADGIEDRNLIINLSDICVSQISIDSERDVNFFVDVDRPVIEMIFFITANSAFYFDENFKNGYAIECNQHNVFFYAKDGYQNSWRPGKNQKAITITLFPENIVKYLSEEKYRNFLKDLESGKSAFLFKQNLTITPKMHFLLKEIVKNQFSDELKRFSIENAVYELFFLQIEQYNTLTKEYKIDIGYLYEVKVNEVKDFIDHHLTEPHSIKSLAQLVGMNDYHLKKYFKQIYGSTVYSYIINKKMEYAKNLLVTESKNVNEVAFLMGYNDPTNFTAAFKKYYGFTPGKILPKI